MNSFKVAHNNEVSLELFSSNEIRRRFSHALYFIHVSKNSFPLMPLKIHWQIHGKWKISPCKIPTNEKHRISLSRNLWRMSTPATHWRKPSNLLPDFSLQSIITWCFKEFNFHHQSKETLSELQIRTHYFTRKYNRTPPTTHIHDYFVNFFPLNMLSIDSLVKRKKKHERKCYSTTSILFFVSSHFMHGSKIMNEVKRHWENSESNSVLDHVELGISLMTQFGLANTWFYWQKSWRIFSIKS